MDDITPVSPQKETTELASVQETSNTPVAPAPDSPEVDTLPSSEVESEVTESPDETKSDTNEDHTDSFPQAADAQKKHGSMPLVIILVVLIVLGLSAAAYLAFAKKDTEQTTNTKAQTQTTQTAAEADATSDPDEASQAIDAALTSVDDSKDYSTNDLSDTTLGL